MTSTAPIPTERLEEILRGTEGVTQGPWDRMDDGPGWDPQVHAINGEHPYGHIVFRDTRGKDNPQMMRDFDYIARLDPDTVRSIVTELLELRKYAANINEALNTGDGSYRP